MRPIRPGMPGGPRMPVAQGVGKPAMGAGTQVYTPRPTSMPMTNVKPAMGMKKGGSASSRADGCAIRGKTKGKII